MYQIHIHKIRIISKKQHLSNLSAKKHNSVSSKEQKFNAYLVGVYHPICITENRTLEQLTYTRVIIIAGKAKLSYP